MKILSSSQTQLIVQIAKALGYEYGIWWANGKSESDTDHYYWLPKFFKTQEDAIPFLTPFSPPYALMRKRDHLWLDFSPHTGPCKANVIHLNMCNEPNQMILDPIMEILK